MGIVTNEVVVETMGRCFFCQVFSPPSHVVEEPNYSSSLVSPRSTSLLESLSRYLQLDMNKVLQKGDLILPRSLAKACRLKLKAEVLCEKCSFINDNFSRLHSQMEKIKMEMSSCLKLILERLEVAEIAETGKAKDIRTLRTDDEYQFGSLDMGKLTIMEALRKETLQKGRSKLKTSLPRLKLKQCKPPKDMPTQKPKSFGTNDEKANKCDDEDFDNSNDENDEASFDDTNSMKYIDTDTDDSLQSPSNQIKLEDFENTQITPHCAAGNQELKLANSRLRSLNKCERCPKTFSTMSKLEEHRKSHDTLEEYEDTEVVVVDKPRSKVVLHVHLPSVNSTKGEAQNLNDNGIDQSIVKLERPVPDQPEPDIVRVDTCAILSDDNQLKVATPNPSDNPSPSSFSELAGKQKFRINPESNKYACLVCSREFFWKETFKIHYKSHEEKRFKCPLCPRKYSTNTLRNRHHREVHQPFTFTCRGCAKTFNKRRFLDTHLKNNEKCRNSPKLVGKGMRTKKYNYTIVTPSHSNLPAMPQLKVNPETLKFVCELCKMEFASDDTFRRHYKNIHLGIKYRCGLCSRLFNSRKCISCHYRSEHLDIEYNNMSKAPRQSEPLNCNLCEREFKNENNYKIHMRSFHEGERERYTCEKCNVSFSLKFSLTRHQLTSSSCPESAPGPSKTKLKHTCHICQKEFAQKSGLQHHVKVLHMGKLGHLCSECGKGFSSSFLLQRHQLVHSGVKEQICEVCGKEYMYKSQLADHHRKEHSGMSEMK